MGRIWAQRTDLFVLKKKSISGRTASNCENHQCVETFWDFHLQTRSGKLPDLHNSPQRSQKLSMAWTYSLTLRMKVSNPDLSLSLHSLCCPASIRRLSLFKRVFFAQHPLADRKDCGTFCSHRKARHGPHWFLLTFLGAQTAPQVLRAGLGKPQPRI